MEPIQLTDGVYNVGVIDWNIRDFHGYSTDIGTTYNSFLIVDEKTVLVDTVRKEFSDQLMDNIAAVIDPKKIDYVISNHTELDHSGGLARVMHKIGEDKPVYASKMGHKNLPKHFRQNLNYHAVANGEVLSLGKRTLTFLETRMIHWPDSMFTYLKEDKILFSSDGFGQHYAGPEKFDDEVGDKIMVHAKKYFANILLLYASHIQKLLNNVLGMGLQFNMICPDHGIIDHHRLFLRLLSTPANVSINDFRRILAPDDTVVRAYHIELQPKPQDIVQQFLNMGSVEQQNIGKIFFRKNHNFIADFNNKFFGSGIVLTKSITGK